MSIKEKLSWAGTTALGLVGMFFLLTLLGLIVKGFTWVAITVLPSLNQILIYLGGICILLLLPLALIKKTRIISVIGLQITAFLSCIYLWLVSLLLVYDYWGAVGCFFGIALGFIGIIPLAFIATMVNGDWSLTGDLTYNLVSIIILYSLMAWILNKTENT